eukprot:GHVS01070864.1.p1 GENE.GHVS01070864.1~~GHVS01070864.1.p1  ORF type:complete len:103 (+),score=10.14 GHVS01070864.1:119-427(+)
MKVKVHLRDRTITVQCGNGDQTLRWLGHVAMFRYDESLCLWSELGPVQSVSLEGGAELPLDGIIRNELKDGQEVWVMFKGLRSNGRGDNKSAMLEQTDGICI